MTGDREWLRKKQLHPLGVVLQRGHHRDLDKDRAQPQRATLLSRIIWKSLELLRWTKSFPLDLGNELDLQKSSKRKSSHQIYTSILDVFFWGVFFYGFNPMINHHEIIIWGNMFGTVSSNKDFIKSKININSFHFRCLKLHKKDVGLVPGKQKNHKFQ